MIFYDFLVYWCLLFNSITTNNQVPVGRTLIRLWSIHLVHGVIPSWRGVAHWQLKKGLEVHSLTANQRWKLTYIRNHQNLYNRHGFICKSYSPSLFFSHVYLTDQDHRLQRNESLCWRAFKAFDKDSGRCATSFYSSTVKICEEL